MARFSELRGRTTSGEGSALSLQKAILTPAIAAMIADGIVEDSELDQLQNLCAFSPIFRGVDGDHLEELVIAVHEEINRIGRDLAVTRAAQKLSPALRDTALCFAARIALADGNIDSTEEDTLVRTAELLEIPNDKLHMIVEVTSMMQYPDNA